MTFQSQVFNQVSTQALAVSQRFIGLSQAMEEKNREFILNKKDRDEILSSDKNAILDRIRSIYKRNCKEVGKVIVAKGESDIEKWWSKRLDDMQYDPNELERRRKWFKLQKNGIILGVVVLSSLLVVGLFFTPAAALVGAISGVVGAVVGLVAGASAWMKSVDKANEHLDQLAMLASDNNRSLDAADVLDEVIKDFDSKRLRSVEELNKCLIKACKKHKVKLDRFVKHFSDVSKDIVGSISRIVESKVYDINEKCKKKLESYRKLTNSFQENISEFDRCIKKEVWYDKSRLDFENLSYVGEQLKKEDLSNIIKEFGNLPGGQERKNLVIGMIGKLCKDLSEKQLHSSLLSKIAEEKESFVDSFCRADNSWLHSDDNSREAMDNVVFPGSGRRHDERSEKKMNNVTFADSNRQNDKLSYKNLGNNYLEDLLTSEELISKKSISEKSISEKSISEKPNRNMFYESIKSNLSLGSLKGSIFKSGKSSEFHAPLERNGSNKSLKRGGGKGLY